MTIDAFRRLALAFPEAVEGEHMGHPDFRVANKIFASLGSPEWGSLKLVPEQQEAVMHAEPDVFEPAAGAWGRHGWTKVRLSAAQGPSVRVALGMAFRNVAPPEPRRVVPARARRKR